MRSPGLRRVPVSTGILMIRPDALDLTSITVIGSITPLACASMMMSRWLTMAVCTDGVVAFFEQAANATRRAALRIRFTGTFLRESAKSALAAGWAGLSVNCTYFGGGMLE